MKKKLKKILFLLILIGILVELMIIIPRRLNQGRSQEIADVAKKLEQEQSTSRLEGIHIVESQNGDRDFELFAKDAEGFQGAGTWNLYDLKVLYYNKEVVDYTVTGKKGFIDGQTKNMDIEGDVNTISKNGYQFKTHSIRYRSKERKITSPDRVLMLGPADKDGAGLVLRGKDMIVHVDKNLMIIEHDIRAEKEMGKGKKAVITSDSAEFSGLNRIARFHGKVRMTYGEMVLEAPEAEFDYGSEGDLLNSVQFSGGVKLNDSTKSATSERVRMNLKAEEVVLDGSPRVVQDQDELRGERIIFLDGGKKVKVEKVKAQMDIDAPK